MINNAMRGGLPALKTDSPLDELEAQLRDVFAVQSMQAELRLTNGIPSDIEGRQDVARFAYLMADAMLAERKK